jgi:L-malate glycosyltransferase
MAVRRWIREFGPDLVHVHYLGFYGVLALLSGAQPLVATAWGSDVLFARSIPRRALVRAILRRADVITCDAQHMVRAIQEIAGGVHVDVINFGIDTKRFAPRSPDLAALATLGVGAKQGPVVLSLRSLLPVYDVETMVRAAPAILSAHPGAVVLIVGDGPERPRLEALNREQGTERGVRFLGRIPNHLLPELLAIADVYVSTSLSDAGLSASTAEAMACEIPVVVTDSGENRLWVDSGVNGVVIPVSDPKALAGAVDGLLRDPDHRRRMARAGRAVIVERNDFETEMGRMERIYARHANAAGGPTPAHAV